ncbi:unnamed protein product [Orchesella dallaii]|uniref:Uncharacterized protein n=1 Tax=Orchesella dallaii TaxID=48710 RepID=A0ABP1S4Q0_9HEXA
MDALITCIQAFILQLILAQIPRVDCKVSLPQPYNPKVQSFVGSFDQIIKDSSSILKYSTKFLDYQKKIRKVDVNYKIENLAEYLQPFNNCLVHYTFYDDFNLQKDLKLPTIQRGLHPHLSLNQYGKYYKAWEFSMISKSLRATVNTTSKTSENSTTCPISTLLDPNTKVIGLVFFVTNFVPNHSSKTTDDGFVQSFRKLCKAVTTPYRREIIVSLTRGSPIFVTQFLIWKKIMENYTMAYGNFQLASVVTKQGDFRCQQIDVDFYIHLMGTGIQIGIADGVDNTQFPIYIKNPAKSLTFVSCGDEPLQTFAFLELFSVFDFYVWIGITVIVILFMPFFLSICQFLEAYINSELESSAKFFNTNVYFQPISLMLEQGGAYTAKQANTASLIPYLASLLLVSIVLTNAYKNDNVYNMIAPRKSIPYTLFNQLVADNFSIYTRITLDPTANIFRLSLFKEKYSVDRNPHLIIGNLNFFKSEVYSRYEKFINFTANGTLFEKVLNHSKLPDDAVALLEASIDNPNQFANGELYGKWQNISMIRRLFKCNRVARITLQSVLAYVKEIRFQT